MMRSSVPIIRKRIATPPKVAPMPIDIVGVVSAKQRSLRTQDGGGLEVLDVQRPVRGLGVHQVPVSIGGRELTPRPLARWKQGSSAPHEDPCSAGRKVKAGRPAGQP